MSAILCSSEFLATIPVAIAYLLIGAACGRHWEGMRVVIDPLKIVAASNRNASLSTLQILFFTFILGWLSLYWLFNHGGLMEVRGDLALLLGIGGAGSLVGKVADKRRLRLSQANFTWIKSKNWIQDDLLKGAKCDRKPQWRDLVETDEKFDIARFQALAFTLIVAAGLVLEGLQATLVPGEGFDFSVGETYLALLGISQGVYVGGKFTSKDVYRQLDEKLDNVRSLERTFMTAIVDSSEWKSRSNSIGAEDNLIALAYECAAKEYVAFESAAEEALELVTQLTGKPVDKRTIRPSLPTIPRAL